MKIIQMSYQSLLRFSHYNTVLNNLAIMSHKLIFAEDGHTFNIDKTLIENRCEKRAST